MEESKAVQAKIGITDKKKKNHWTRSKVDAATKKINQEIYKRNRQAAIHIKIDDLSILINDKITRIYIVFKE